jgi:hypothetical protein
MCQMSMIKPCTNMGLCKFMYINLSNLCNISIQYKFYFLEFIDGVVPKLTVYLETKNNEK